MTGRKGDEHERELLRDAAGDDLGVDDESLHDVLEGRQDDVGGEERLRNGDATVRSGNRDQQVQRCSARE